MSDQQITISVDELNIMVNAIVLKSVDKAMSLAFEDAANHFDNRPIDASSQIVHDAAKEVLKQVSSFLRDTARVHRNKLSNG